MKYFAKIKASDTHTDVEFYRSETPQNPNGLTIYCIRVFKAWSAEFGSVNVCMAFFSNTIITRLDTFEEITEEQFTKYAILYDVFSEVENIMRRHEKQIESLFA